MASKRKAFLSRSVSLSLAALIVLTGAMFLITTLEQDHQEWVLVEDQVLDEYQVSSGTPIVAGDAGEYDFSFDEETATYSYVVTGGDKASTNKYNLYSFVCLENFDFSKNYKFVVTSSDIKFWDFGYFSHDGVTMIGESQFSLRTVVGSDDGYTASIILRDQKVTDLSFKDAFGIRCDSDSATSTFLPNTFSLQVYELHDDNAGSVAAAITGLTLIVMGVFATPMLNVFRRR